MLPKIYETFHPYDCVTEGTMKGLRCTQIRPSFLIDETHGHIFLEEQSENHREMEAHSANAQATGS